jgi:glycerol-3-phosphate O-acyltransferase
VSPPLGSVVVLTQARSATEQALLARWAATEYPGAALVEVDPRRAGTPHDGLEWLLTGPRASGQATGADQRLIVPARVAWIPVQDDQTRRGQVKDLLSVAALRRPWAPLHGPLARLVPDAARVVAGDPASIDSLRTRFDADARPDSVDGGSFARYVVRQGTLACDRSERRIVGDRYKVPRLMVEQITASGRFADLVGRLAAQTGQTAGAVESQVRRCLTEMVAVQSPLAIDTFRALMGPLHSKAWNVDVDEPGLERLRALNQEHPLVFLPSHRSYADPLLFAEVLHARNFPRNHVLGGNNMAFGPIGPLGRRAGVVFIRRTFGDDVIYKAAIREYLGHLMDKRFNLEWYIEGGRTRTGKLRRPRYGLLRYLAEALDDRPGVDAVLVPVSIVYDQLHEAGAMAAEQRGAVKSAEGMRWLARYMRDQRSDSGVARVRFGEPFSLRAALAESEPGGSGLEKVAFRVCAGINKATAVTANSLVTYALLATRDRALTLEQVSDVVAPLAAYLESRDLPAPIQELRTRASLRETLERLAEARVTRCYDEGTEAVYSIEPGRHHVAAFYRNGALHHLVNRGLAELALLRASRAGDDADLMQEGWTYLWALRDLLKFEFFFSDKRGFSSEVLAEVDLLHPAWRKRSSGARDCEQALRSAPLLVAHGTLRTFFDAQLVVAEALADFDHDAPVDRAALLDQCLGLGRQLVLQHRLDRADSVSAELYASALRLADNRGLVESGGPELTERRREYRDEVAAVLDDLAWIGGLETERLECVLSGAEHGKVVDTRVGASSGSDVTG